MAPPGRKPKPTHLKLVTGNPGKRKMKTGAEPKPVREMMMPPPQKSNTTPWSTFKLL